MSYSIQGKFDVLSVHLKLDDNQHKELMESNEDFTGERDEELTWEGESYKVFTDIEYYRAKQAAGKDYIDEVVLPKIPKQYRVYFDRESYLLDCEINGDLNGLISPYDGAVHGECKDGKWYYIIHS